MEKANRPKNRAKAVSVMVLFLAAAVLSAVLMGKVAINYNLADYLGSDTQTKIALDIIDDEFGMTGNIQVMAKNVSADTAEEMQGVIEAIPNVLNANFDKYDDTYYKNRNALFIVIIDGDDYSENAKQVSADIRSALSSYNGIKPVSASALTTMAGLLALLFMSFWIGFDIGIVLMKGIVLVCGVLQAGNSFIFTDTKSGNAAISDTFGKNNSVVVVYKSSENGFENEKKLADALSAYKTKEGRAVLTNYTAYSNTVRETYDSAKAVQKLEISEKDAEMLFTMYNIYSSPYDVQMSFADFISFADSLIGTDEDVKEFIDGDTTKTLKNLKAVSEIMQNARTADELHTGLTNVMPEGTDISAFSVKQLYGMYFYDSVAEKNVDFGTMLDFLIIASENDNIKEMFDEAAVTQLKTLQAGINRFKAQMETPMDKEALKGWIYQNCGIVLSDMQLSQLYGGYFAATGETAGEMVPFLPLMKFIAGSGQITDESAAAAITGYDSLYKLINEKYGYGQFLSALSEITAGLSDRYRKLLLQMRQCSRFALCISIRQEPCRTAG